eukprot:363424-Chlamydomonas_euryale.AAC.5
MCVRLRVHTGVPVQRCEHVSARLIKEEQRDDLLGVLGLVACLHEQSGVVEREADNLRAGEEWANQKLVVHKLRQSCHMRARVKARARTTGEIRHNRQNAPGQQ